MGCGASQPQPVQLPHHDGTSTEQGTTSLAASNVQPLSVVTPQEASVSAKGGTGTALQAPEQDTTPTPCVGTTSLAASSAQPLSVVTPQEASVTAKGGTGTALQAPEGDKTPTPCVDSSVPPVALMGISLRGIRRLRSSLQDLCASATSPFAKPTRLLDRECPGVQSFEQLTTTQLVHLWVLIKEEAVTGTKRLAEVSHLVDPADIGVPTYFISHAWQSTVTKLFDTIEAFLVDAADDTCVWLDFVAINQHDNFAQNKEDVAAFEACLKKCSGGTLVVVDQERCNPATRGWCLFEWDYTLLHHGPDGLHMRGMRAKDLDAIVSSIKVEDASCVRPADLQMIKDNILKHHHSFSAFDTRLKLHLMLDPLSYKVDIQQLTDRSRKAGTQWDWELVRKFLLQPPEQGRALCILAGAGTGKSTISAALAQQLLGRRNHDSSDQDGAWVGPVTAVHFTKHSDQRRLDPVRIIKSLLYQLAVRLGVAADLVLKLSAKDVAEMRQPEAAFEQLLLPALASIQEPVVLLLDALDEADPPEEQRPDFDPTKATVKACGNAVLSMLVSQLAPRLPQNVKFILTSSPEASCHGIRAALERTFPDGVTFLTPDDVRVEAVSGSCSGQAHPSKLLVLDTVVSECGLTRGTSGAPIGDLHAAYRAVFERSPPTGKVAELLQLLLAAQEPLSTSFLQQLGFGGPVLQQLPGWKCLFFESEHHIYLLHKSLSDWLLLPRDKNPFAPNTAAGHQALGAQLLQDAWRSSSSVQASEYCLKYAVLHLCNAGPDCMQLLDAVLSHWDFLRAAITTGHGGKLLAALGMVDSRSAYSTDAYRWLARFINDFERRPEAMEDITVSDLLCPVSCLKLREAARRLNMPWIPRFKLGGYGNEWPPDTSTLKGHSGDVRSVAFSPDGKQLATGSDDNTAKVWDLASGTCTATLQGHNSYVNNLAFSPDGKQLATGSYDKTAKVWDLASGTCTAMLQGHYSYVFSVAFSPDGKQLATGSGDKTANVWDLASGTCTATLQGHNNYVSSVAFSRDGRQLATGSGDKTAKVWDLASGTCTATLQGHNNYVFSVAFSPDGKQLATGSGDKTAKVWDLASGTCTATLEGHNNYVYSVACSPDGKQLATGSRDKTAKVWDLASGTCTATLQGHSSCVFSVAFGPDGKQLATGSDDKTAKVWDLASGTCTVTLQGHNNDVFCVAFSPDGKELATGSGDKTAKVWDLASGTCTATLQGHNNYVSSVAFSPDGKQLATGSGDKTAKVWDLASGTCTATLQGHNNCVFSVAFGPDIDGKQLATSSNTTAKVWDLASGTCTAALQGHYNYVSSVALSCDGKQLAMGMRNGPAVFESDKTANVWDLASGTCTATLQVPYGNFDSLAFSPDGKQLATNNNTTAKVWDLASGTCTATLRVHKDKLLSMAFSPDGKQLATSSGDKIVKVWDLANGTCTATLQGHSGNVSSVAFSPDGKQLATGSSDNTTKVWDMASGTCTATQ